MSFVSLCYGQMSPEEAKAQLEKSETTSVPADNTVAISALQQQVVELKATVAEQDREIKMLKARLAKYEPPTATIQTKKPGVISLDDLLGQMPPAMKSLPIPLNSIASDQQNKWYTSQMIGKTISVDAGLGTAGNTKNGPFIHTFPADQTQLPSHKFEIEAAVQKDQGTQLGSISKKTPIRITGKIISIRQIGRGGTMILIGMSDCSVELIASDK